MNGIKTNLEEHFGNLWALAADFETVNHNTGLRFLGASGLTGLLEKTGWRLERVQEENPISAVLTLKKDRSVAVSRAP